ncbi:acyltransferase family protein [Secundilactobacillus folii]|uniref:Acyltransferase family protein n=1 Tax=Secundilactobacillus folii TaxID=2678357 RepID=A0A7X3C4F7_9LACO|nr:acyltransferase [Secundilactobacillus folii]MTV83324.1 acyltransferase family protein [Secundilactobacillus folii]
MGKRIEWVDMAKAIGMIAVVTGHAIHPLVNQHPMMSTAFSAIYWWHMPLFFIISGFFLKPIQQGWQGFKAFLGKRIFPNVRTYLVAGGILILISHFLRAQTWKYTALYFVRLLYGGATLNHELSIFWYMTVYILTLVVVVAIISWVDSIPAQFFIVLMMYMSGMTYVHMHFFQFKYVPWDADIVLIASLYMLCGYYGFRYYSRLPHKPAIALSILLVYAILIVRKYQGVLRFSFYLKSHTIANSFLGAFIPLTLCLGVFILSDYMTRLGWFKFLLPIGWYSGVIMYSHKMFFDVIGKFPTINFWWTEVIFGLIAPIFVAVIWHFIKRWVGNLRQPPATN